MKKFFGSGLDRPLLLCHRGLHTSFPENTLDAFSAAAELAGVDGVELDVRCSADGLAVLFHDAETVGGKSLETLSRESLQEEVGFPIATLDEALLAQPQLLWNVEIKSEDAVDPALQVLASCDHPEKILITSFDHGIVARFSEETSFLCGVLSRTPPADLEVWCESWARSPSVQCFVWHRSTINEDLVQRCKALGYHNLVYGTESLEDHKLALELGLDGVITDFPEKILQLI
jgi:glycerophosphoryl diester phosphodiesterase